MFSPASGADPPSRMRFRRRPLGYGGQAGEARGAAPSVSGIPAIRDTRLRPDSQRSGLRVACEEEREDNEDDEDDQHDDHVDEENINEDGTVRQSTARDPVARRLLLRSAASCPAKPRCDRRSRVRPA